MPGHIAADCEAEIADKVIIDQTISPTENENSIDNENPLLNPKYKISNTTKLDKSQKRTPSDTASEPGNISTTKVIPHDPKPAVDKTPKHFEKSDSSALDCKMKVAILPLVLAQ